MRKIVICICGILLFVNMFVVCDAAEKYNDESVPNYIGILRTSEKIESIGDNNVLINLKLMSKSPTSFSNVVMRIEIRKVSGNVKCYDKQFTRYYSEENGGYTLSETIKLPSKGKYKLIVEYKCYKNGKLIDRKIADPIYV